MISLKFVVIYFFCYFSIVTLNSLASEGETLVTIPQGTLRGRKEVSPLGGTYYSFQGIPYGKPPVGELRFKPPHPAEKWTGILDASTEGNNCYARDMWAPKLVKNASEDCLVVHVYTKEIPKPGKRYPVMVWIHGGGYDFGYGNKNQFSPDYFMSYDIVFASINYRLGALGFLSLETLDCPGNFGLKDQQLGLKWIKENIFHFGGNPDSITILGESAGGASVHNQLLSPKSKGLFHRAICMSAVSNNFWGYQRHPRQNAYLLGKRLGYHAKNDKDLLAFLRKVPAEEIVEKTSRLLAETEGAFPYENLVNVSFVPIAEPEHEEAFITKRPLTGEYQADVPLIIGNTDKEMIMEIYSQEQVPHWTEDRDFQEILPRGFPVKKNSKKSIEIARKIREFYFKDGMTLDGYIDALSDTYFNYGVHRAIKYRFDQKLKSPTYIYLFTFDGEFCFVKKYIEQLGGKSVNIKGVGHADELSYFFKLYLNEGPNFKVIPGSPEHKTIQRVTQMWVNFATTGVPTNEKSEIKWPPAEACDGIYLDIGQVLELKKGLFKERMEFWDEIYKSVGEKV